MRDDDADFVVWVLRAILDVAPGIPSNAIIRSEQLIRSRWGRGGGTRPYIAKHPGPRGAEPDVPA